jgi:hypothetical protein
MDPTGDVEASDSSTPGCQEWGRDLQWLSNAMAIDHNLSILVS